MLSKENELIGKRLGESGWDRGEGGLEGSVDVDIVIHAIFIDYGRGRKETNGGLW